MPRATADIQSTVRKDLKTLPEGFVVLRRMSYGLQLERREMLKMTMGADKEDGGEFVGELALASTKITQFEFAYCIVDHNLEDENGRKLQFSNSQDFRSLDPRIGQEIEKLISDMNNVEKIEENSEAGSEQV